ncbi:hypothetical protein [Streptomyces sp. CBMA123]|uniref:hypothetical protein n=1 Tax=Streptomyces sp. CBMA123 TaxID=1896313 RepID=UPI001661ADA8|nr:hypothetical protein [Streptomyces sp. CBMA123]MBD0689353.1 hypothetical protein [Streptomyces sp. CBMA123]
MPEPVRAAAPFGDPSPQTCLQVAGEAALLAVIAADDAMAAVCRSRSGAARLEVAMHAAHQEAVEAARHADRAERYADDPEMPASALAYCARQAVHHAVLAQAAAGVETTAAGLRAELDRVLTPAELAERESARRREEAQREAEQQAATGMDRQNREQAASNLYLAERHVAELGWATGHLLVMEAAATGRLYWRGGCARLAVRHGEWTGGRRISQERTQALLTAKFLTTAQQSDGTHALTPSPMGHVALELARLHQDGLHATYHAAYEARFARVRRRHKRRDDQKAAARRLPPLDPSAQKLYQKPVTIAEQQAFASQQTPVDPVQTSPPATGAGPLPAANSPQPAPAPTTTPRTPAPAPQKPRRALRRARPIPVSPLQPALW